jgi:hypothetical protein
LENSAKAFPKRALGMRVEEKSISKENFGNYGGGKAFPKRALGMRVGEEGY